MKKLLVLGMFSSVSYAKSAIICESSVEDLNQRLGADIVFFNERVLDEESNKLVVRKNFIKGKKTVSAPMIMDKSICVTVSD